MTHAAQLLRMVGLALTLPLAMGMAEPPAPAMVRIVSYNILADHHGPGWAARRATVLGFLDDPGRDIVAIQEATEPQIADMAAALPHMAYVVGERSDGHRGDQGWYEYNPIFYDPVRFSLLAHSSFWVSDTPTTPGSILPGTKRHARVLTWARLRDRRTGQPVLIANAHIHGFSPTIRRGRDEVQIMLNQLKAHHAGEPVVLLGDFNFDAASSAYQLLIAGPPQFADAAPPAERQQGTLIGPAGITLDGSRSGPLPRQVAEDRRIDYVFVCGLRRTGAYAVTPLAVSGSPYQASDHVPVSVSLQLGRACPLRTGPA